MSAQEYRQYEESRLGYLTDKAAMDTAKKKGDMERVELVIKNCIQHGFTIALTAQIAVTTLNIVKDVIKKYNLKQHEG